MEGYLNKYTNFMKHYEYRYCVADDEKGTFKYFRNDDEMKRNAPRATYSLQGASISLDSNDDCGFVVNCVNTKIYLKASDVNYRDSWVSKLQNIILKHSRTRDTEKYQSMFTNKADPVTRMDAQNDKSSFEEQKDDCDNFTSVRSAICDLEYLLKRSIQAKDQDDQNKEFLYQKLDDLNTELHVLNKNLQKTLHEQAAEKSSGVEKEEKIKGSTSTGSPVFQTMISNRVYCTQMEIIIENDVHYRPDLLSPIVKLLNLGEPLGARQLTKELESLYKIKERRGQTAAVPLYRETKACLNFLCEKGLVCFNDYTRKYETCIKPCTMVKFTINN